MKKNKSKKKNKTGVIKAKRTALRLLRNHITHLINSGGN